MVRDLSGALERAQAENRRTRVLGELGGSIDLDEVLARTLDAAGALEGVDAAVDLDRRRGRRATRRGCGSRWRGAAGDDLRPAGRRGRRA